MDSPTSTPAEAPSRSISPFLKNIALLLAGCFLMLVLVLLYTKTGSLKSVVASWLGFNKEEVVTNTKLIEVMKPFVAQVQKMENELGPGGLVAWKQSRDREFKLAVDGMSSAITSPATVEGIKKEVADLQGALKKAQEENAALKTDLSAARNDIKTIVSYIETNLYPALQSVQQQSASTKTAVDNLVAVSAQRVATYQTQPEANSSYVPTGVVIATPTTQGVPPAPQTHVQTQAPIQTQVQPAQPTHEAASLPANVVQVEGEKAP